MGVNQCQCGRWQSVLVERYLDHEIAGVAGTYNLNDYPAQKTYVAYAIENRVRQAIGMKTFGASAPLKELQKKFGFTAEAVIAAAREQVARNR